ncbi:orotate phosphoribosyltransferase [uncultured Bifidobacterium sp.]|uniref:orotate phosphoribosyltransferase n=1 Tax=uncultured Bifidobacterium sp. TaxID=165187 RepID=UPI0028DBF8A1|nr:orotate phosphoribosyltransferase [uncultured Bifidobacterium sp.]
MSDDTTGTGRGIDAVPGFRASADGSLAGGAGTTHDNRLPDDAAFVRLTPREQIRSLLEHDVRDRPFSELFEVTFDHRAAGVGHLLLDALEERGFSTDDFDAVGALTAAAVPLVCAMVHAAASRGQDLDGFVMDFVYPSVKGPSIAGRRVVLVDSWLSEKSYVQTSSLVTLRNGNELSLDFGIVTRHDARIVAVEALVGGIGGAEEAPADDAASAKAAGAVPGFVPVRDPTSGPFLAAVDPVAGTRHELPFVGVFDESELHRPLDGRVSGADSDPAGHADRVGHADHTGTDRASRSDHA